MSPIRPPIRRVSSQWRLGEAPPSPGYGGQAGLASWAATAGKGGLKGGNFWQVNQWRLIPTFRSLRSRQRNWDDQNAFQAREFDCALCWAGGVCDEDGLGVAPGHWGAAANRTNTTCPLRARLRIRNPQSPRANDRRGVVPGRPIEIRRQNGARQRPVPKKRPAEQESAWIGEQI
jgi:hypothetical protein